MHCEFCKEDMSIEDYDFCDICPECLEDSGY
jgi:uncharacterized CHY-type Zn-finger protein